MNTRCIQNGNNWRFLELPSFNPVPSATKDMLEKPTVFELEAESGKVRSVVVSSEEPEWSVNFKKALANLFQTQTMLTETVNTNSVSDLTHYHKVDKKFHLFPLYTDP